MGQHLIFRIQSFKYLEVRASLSTPVLPISVTPVLRVPLYPSYSTRRALLTGLARLADLSRTALATYLARRADETREAPPPHAMSIHQQAVDKVTAEAGMKKVRSSLNLALSLPTHSIGTGISFLFRIILQQTRIVIDCPINHTPTCSDPHGYWRRT